MKPSCRSGRLVEIKRPIPQQIEQEIISKFSFYRRNKNPFTGKFEISREDLYRIINDSIYLPVGLLLHYLLILKRFGYELPLDSVSEALNLRRLRADWKNLNPESLRPLQRDCIKKILSHLSHGLGGVVIAPPAFGKTYLIGVLSYLLSSYRIDIISKRRDVVFGIYNQILKFLPNVGLVTTGFKTKRNVTVYTMQSIGYSDFDADLVILDEVHELVTDNFYEKLLNYDDAVMLGLTATFDTRFDRLYKRCVALCGPVIYKVSYKDVLDQGFVVPIAVKWVEVLEKPEILDETNDITLKRTAIWCNEKRNRKIAEIARQLISQGKQTLILVDTIEHALNLAKLLPEFKVCYAGTPEENYDPSFAPRISNKERNALRDAFIRREILGVISTKIWSVGVSIDGLDCVIRGDGGVSETACIQIPGRVSRIFPDKEYGLVIDFEDSFHPRLERHSLLRRRRYLEYGWVQVLPNGKLQFPQDTEDKKSFLSGHRKAGPSGKIQPPI